MPGIVRNLFSVKLVTKKGIVFIFDFDNPRLKLSGITVPLRAEDDNLYSLVCDVSADNHGGKELAMNVMTNAQLWHRRLGRLNKRTFEPMQRRDGNGVALLIDHCDVCTVRNVTSWLTPRRLNTPTLWRPSIGLWRPDGPL